MAIIELSEIKILIRQKYQDEIEKYRQKIKDLEAEMEDRLRRVGGEDTEGVPVRMALRRLRAPTENIAKSNAIDRLMNARDKFANQLFTRAELHEKINADGSGDMPYGTFSVKLSELKKLGKIKDSGATRESGEKLYSFAKE